jgi:hypothetical protein
MALRSGRDPDFLLPDQNHAFSITSAARLPVRRLSAAMAIRALTFALRSLLEWILQKPSSIDRFISISKPGYGGTSFVDPVYPFSAAWTRKFICERRLSYTIPAEIPLLG